MPSAMFDTSDIYFTPLFTEHQQVPRKCGLNPFYMFYMDAKYAIIEADHLPFDPCSFDLPIPYTLLRT